MQSLVRFKSGAAGMIEASRVAVGKVLGIQWEVSGTEGTIINDGERFNELKVARLSDPKPDRGFKTLLVGSQIPQFRAFLPFDYGGGGLGYFDVKVIEVHDLIEGIFGERLLPRFRLRPRQPADCGRDRGFGQDRPVDQGRRLTSPPPCGFRECRGRPSQIVSVTLTR